jgi:peptidoglycan/xylan/chitin deacetylase (PgdA/CDA1 family)
MGRFRTSAATFTFDDGVQINYSLAVPVFDKFGYKASFYLCDKWESQLVNI